MPDSPEPRSSLPPDYFEAVYARDPDPWRFETSAYERAKYQATLGALPRDRFSDAFEVGCANGALTERLAGRCDALLAVDVVDRVLDRARERCAQLPHVRIARMRIPYDWPTGKRFDLIIYSEVLYYLSLPDLMRSARLTLGSLTEHGVVVLVHYTEPTNYPLSGDAAADGFIKAAGLTPVLQWREEHYRLDVLAS